MRDKRSCSHDLIHLADISRPAAELLAPDFAEVYFAEAAEYEALLEQVCEERVGTFRSGMGASFGISADRRFQWFTHLYEADAYSGFPATPPKKDPPKSSRQGESEPRILLFPVRRPD